MINKIMTGSQLIMLIFTLTVVAAPYSFAKAVKASSILIQGTIAISEYVFVCETCETCETCENCDSETFSSNTQLACVMANHHRLVGLVACFFILAISLIVILKVKPFDIRDLFQILKGKSPSKRE